jgi:hypothetical protein
MKDFAMISKTFSSNILHAIGTIVLSSMAAFGQEARDLVDGNLIQFNDNGAWSWYQDERAVVDAVGGKLIVGSDASDNGVGGSLREGDVEAVLFDFQTGSSQRFTLKEGNPIFYADDHNAPALLVRPDGKYLAMYAAHFSDTTSHYRIYSDGVWGSEQIFNWKTERPGGVNFQTTYSNLFYLSAEDRVYNVVRGHDRSPNFMFSTDRGDTWSYGGMLTNPDQSIGYVNGYFKYWSNGIDRIDFICTEHHPRDYNTGIYHGYIKNGQSFKSDGTLMDSDIFDSVAPRPAAFSRVFAAGTVVNGMTMTRCWTIDVQSYDDGTVAAIFKTRINDTTPPSNNPNHAFFYTRYDGSSWTSTYLGQAGLKMYNSEQDYVGLGALHPNDPATIYLSTPFDPRDDTALGVREIFKGVTADHGLTWSWTPITRNSGRNNFRPIVPAWDEKNTALLWWRGTYLSAQNYDAAVVGIIERQSETVGLMRYVDATAANTFFADGSPLVTTGPAANQGADDDQWHERTSFGNGGSILASSETGNGENAPVLKTYIVVTEAGGTLDEGTYDLWVNFWANPTADWRIKAGLSDGGMQVFRHMASQQVEAGAHEIPIVLTGSDNVFLYQAYVGRATIAANEAIAVFVDDHAIQTGTASPLIGNTARTWYDGISYAKVDKSATVDVSDKEELPIGFSLSQNYPNPFNPTTTITYSLQREARVNLKVYNLLGQEMATLVNHKMSAGAHRVTWNAQGLPSGLYFYKIRVGDDSKVNKMMLVK